MPDAVIACVGGGSNAIGMFTAFLEDTDVELFGVEAGGRGLTTNQHGASLSKGRPGVLHGTYTYLLQDEHGQVQEAHSISAGLDYPGVGPEHSYLKETGRVNYTAITDEEALQAVSDLCQYEGILPALESAHAIARAMQLAADRSKEELILVCLSGRGDKDVETIRQYKEGEQLLNALQSVFAETKPVRLIPFLVTGDPSISATIDLIALLEDEGVAAIELGVPFSDPIADGPVIQSAAERALKHQITLRDVLDVARSARKRGCRVPLILFSYYNPLLQYGLQGL